MSEKKPMPLKRSFLGSYFTTTLSISMILFLIGILAILLINARRLTNHMKENIGITLVLKDQAKEADVMKLEKSLEETPYIKSTKYVDKERAATDLKAELGEDFVDFLGYNPLLSSIDVSVFADYANPDSLASLEKKFLTFPEVQEVYYHRNLVRQLNANVKEATIILLAISILIFIIFLALINNTIRMTIYSKRFLINTMQLVGATRSFIRRPFLIKSALHGFYGGLIACSAFLLLFFTYQQELKSFVDFQNPTYLILVAGVILGLGIFLTLISTYLAVNKFLKMKFDQLFY